jgi:hypothetical protein
MPPDAEYPRVYRGCPSSLTRSLGAARVGCGVGVLQALRLLYGYFKVLKGTTPRVLRGTPRKRLGRPNGATGGVHLCLGSTRAVADARAVTGTLDLSRFPHTGCAEAHELRLTTGILFSTSSAASVAAATPKPPAR